MLGLSKHGHPDTWNSYLCKQPQVWWEHEGGRGGPSSHNQSSHSHSRLHEAEEVWNRHGRRGGGNPEILGHFFGFRLKLVGLKNESRRVLYLAGLLWFLCLWCSYSSRVRGRTTSSECGWKPTKTKVPTIISSFIVVLVPQWKHTFTKNKVLGCKNISLQSP